MAAVPHSVSAHSALAYRRYATPEAAAAAYRIQQARRRRRSSIFVRNRFYNLSRETYDLSEHSDDEAPPLSIAQSLSAYLLGSTLIACMKFFHLPPIGAPTVLT